jgi:hypothetical protein
LVYVDAASHLVSQCIMLIRTWRTAEAADLQTAP